MKLEQKEVIAEMVEVENFVTEPNLTPTATKVSIEYRNTPNKQVFVEGDANAEFEVIDDSNGAVVGKGKTDAKGQSLVICDYISKTLKAVALSLICVINIFAQQTTQVNVQQQTVTATAPIVKTGTVLSISPASTTSAGSMSSADKIKLNSLTPITLTNNAAPFSFNATTQVGNIPQVPSIVNGQLVQGDGTPAEQIPDFWRTVTGTLLPDGTTDVTDAIKHNSDIYVGLDGLVTVGHGGGNISTNTALGNDALLANTTGTNNVATGNQGLFSNLTGSRNVGIGFQSLFSNTTGSNNQSLGFRSLYNNTSGFSNTSVGFESLFYNTTGYTNNSFGFRSLFSNVAGIDNTAIGYQSLYSNTTGNENSSNGKEALYSNTIGINNVAIGNRSLYSNVSGSNNVSTGYQSLFNSTTGINNVGNGRDALYYNQESNNTALGNVSFNNYNLLLSGATITASSTTQVTLSAPMTPVPLAGSFISVSSIGGYTNTISGFIATKSYKVINATTLEVTDPSQVLGLIGTATNFEIRQSKGYTNSTALGNDAEPTASNQVMLGNTAVTAVVSTGTFFGAGFTVASDKRIKSDITDLTAEMITALKSIKPKIYKNANTGKTEMGVIAQDIPAILRPYLVTIIPEVYSKVKSAELKLTLVKTLGFKTVSDYTKAVTANDAALLLKPDNEKLLEERERLTITNDSAYFTDFYSVDYAKLAAMVALVK